MPTTIAIFDLDHTLLRVNGSYHFGAYLYRKGDFSWTTMCCLVGNYYRHKAMGMSIARLHEKIFDRLFKGKVLADFEAKADVFLDASFQALLYEPAVLRLQRLKSEGAFTAILSSSPDFLVRKFAQRLGVDEACGTVYAVDKDGVLCTISHLMEGREKVDYCFSLASRLGVNMSCLQAYSDSYLDLPFLEVAGTAVVVNPDKRLHRVSLERKWEVL